MPKSYIDFRALKARIRIEQAAQMLQLQFVGRGNEQRTSCPACQSGGDRALSIDAKDDSFACWSQGNPPPEGYSGDVIGFVAHVKRTGMRNAAQMLLDHFGGAAKPVAKATTPAPKKVEDGGGSEFGPLDYLVSDHEAVQALGFAPATALALGIGYSPRGSMRGCVLIPVWVDGRLSGYVGLDLENGAVKLPKEWHGLAKEEEPEPEDTKIIKFPKRA